MQRSRFASALVAAVLLVVTVLVMVHDHNKIPVVQLLEQPYMRTSHSGTINDLNELEYVVDVPKHDNIRWHIKPMKPHHTGHVQYVTEISSDRNHLIYKRIFNAPCGYGMLVFNVGPAALYEPYTYELYDDAYAYSNNEGLCVLYPSYNGVQESTSPLWSFNDEMEMTVPLGDTPTQISTRIVIPPNTKHINSTNPTKYHGGDYLIIRDGNFYNPTYYKNLKELINHWPPTVMEEDIPNLLMELVATL